MVDRHDFDRRRGLTAIAFLVLSGANLVACGSETESSGGEYIVFEGTNVAQGQEDWFDDTYIETLAGHPDVTKMESYASLGSPFEGTLEAATYLTLFHFQNESAPADFVESSEAEDAADAIDETEDEASMAWRAAFKAVSVSENEDADGSHPIVTFVALDPDPEVEDEVMEWEDETHVPWLLEYEGLAKVVRYERIPDVDENADDIPKFIELFYYRDQEAFDGWGSSEPFQEAEEDRKETWTDEELAIPWVMWSELAIDD